jgi:hypothetical protein
VGFLFCGNRIWTVKKQYLILATLVSLISTTSLFGTEAFYSSGYPAGVPWAVFGFLAVTSFSAVAALAAGISKFTSNKLAGASVVLVGIVSLWAWITLFVDQLPCFFGGSGC